MFCNVLMILVANCRATVRTPTPSSMSVLCLATLLSASPHLALAAEWFETKIPNCSGVEALNAAASALVKRSVDIKAGAGAGTLYARMNAAALNAALDSRNEQIVDAITLNQAQATDLRTAVQNTAQDLKVPQFAEIGSSLLTGLALPALSGTGGGILFSYLFGLQNENALSVKEASLFIAKGGLLYRRVFPKKGADDNYYVSVTTEYKVMVGDEPRTFVFHGCVYPLSVIVTEIRTKATINDKILKNIGGSQWRVFDVTDNRFEGEIMNYTKQEGSFYYFSIDVIELDRVKGQDVERVSFIGGPWQHQHVVDFPGEGFKNFYKETVSR